jgi:D-alanyl-D-alanine dipeptidase
MKFTFIFSILFCILFFDCHAQIPNVTSKSQISSDSITAEKFDLTKLKKTDFLNILKLDSTFVLDMPYATENNFLKQQVYDCESCYLRKKTAIALIKANTMFKKLGYHIKIYDCYRPLDVQKKMWTIISDPKYVANPATGSIHNRGGAVDITLVNANNVELNMGTQFDFFGEEASHFYQNLPDDVLENRKLLKKILSENGFVSFDSEWWHYNLKAARKMKISNFKWNCD